MLLGIAPVLKWLTQAKMDRFQKVPGIWFFGVYFQVLPFGIRFFEKLAEFSQKYGAEGVYEMDNLGERIVVTCCRETAMEVLEKRPYHIIRGDPLTERPLFGGCAFSNGKQWQKERRLICPFLSEKPVAAAAGKLEQVVDVLLSGIAAESQNGREGVASCLRLLTLANDNMLAAVLTGEEPLEERPSEWSEATTAYGLAALMTLLPLVSSLRDWGIPIFGSKLSSAKQRALDACMAKGADGTFVGRLRSLVSTGEMCGNEVAQFIVSIVFAGHAPGATAAWALYHLAQLPEVQDSIVRELEHDQKKSTWAQAVWLEALRLYPLETHNYRTADTVTIAGRKVPAGTKVLIHMRHLLQNFHEPKLGEDLHEFRPGRWIGPNGIHSTPFNSLVFGHGSRECVGRLLAESFGPMVIAKVAERFVLSPDHDSQEKTFKDGPGAIGTPELTHANVRFKLRGTKGQPLDDCDGISNYIV